MPDSSKTEKATPKKREDERKKGNITQSRDVVSALSILVIFFVLKLMFPIIYRHLANFITKYFGFIKTMDTISIPSVIDIFKDVMITILLLAGPTLLASIAMSIIATGMQTKFKFSREHIKFKFSKLSPIQGVKRLVSLRSITELIKAMIKISVIGLVLFQTYKKIYDQFSKLMFQDITQAISFILNTIMDIVMQLSIVFIGIAVLDYAYQWWDHERNLRMSKQEIKEEYRQMEGDPQVKGQIKERQRKISMQRMMQQVPTADVIIRNPTHFAVALKYDIEKNSAPIVVAKGQDYMALRIIDIAQEHSIPMTENKPLARLLYDTVPVNREIPPEYYSVLAEVLAWVYSMKKETKRD